LTVVDKVRDGTFGDEVVGGSFTITVSSIEHATSLRKKNCPSGAPV
jgi:hypothetical protein